MGKFASFSDITDRYEGDFPVDREDWVNVRIDDVEAELVGLVPSLDVPVDQLNPARVQRVRRLVADKVIDLFDSTDFRRLKSKTVDDVTEQYRDTLGRIAFTEDELAGIRARRSRFGTMRVDPWRITC